MSMKKNILMTSLIVCLFVGNVFSRDNAAGGFRQSVWKSESVSPRLVQGEIFLDEKGKKRDGFRIFGGLSISDITHSDVPEMDPDRFKQPKTGLVAGLGYEFGTRLGVEFDVLYFQKGVVYEGSFSEAIAGFNGNFKGKAFIEELSALVLAKLRLRAGPAPYILGGGEFAYILKCKGKYEFNNITENQSQSGTEEYTVGVNRIDYGLVFGLGLELQTGPVSLFLEGRYHLGLADIAGTDDEIPELKKEDWVKTNAIAVVLGVKLDE